MPSIRAKPADLACIACQLEQLILRRPSKWKLGESIGEGGQATVYRATHKVLGTVFALKYIPIPLKNEATVSRFMTECQVLGDLKIPGVPMSVDAGTGVDYCFIVMEMLAGDELGTWLADLLGSAMTSIADTASRSG